MQCPYCSHEETQVIDSRVNEVTVKRRRECEKCKMAENVERKMRNLGKAEVKSILVGKLVMKELLKADQIAYLRFASVCKSFDNLNQFEEELKTMRGEER